MVDISQDNGSDKVALLASLSERERLILGCGVDSTLLESVVDVGLNFLLGDCGYNRASSGGLVQGITQFISNVPRVRKSVQIFSPSVRSNYSVDLPLQFFLHTANEFVIYLLMHINPLDGAAALTRVKHCSIHQVLGHALDIDVGANVCGVITAQLQMHRLHLLGSSLSETDTARSRSGERHGLDFWNLSDLVKNIQASNLQNLKDILGQTSLVESLG